MDAFKFEFIEWDKEKNDKLLLGRGVNFDTIVKALEKGGKAEVIDHPNQNRYPNQQMLIIWIHQYAYAVPFVQKSPSTAFFKTLYPSRKFTKQYSKKKNKP